MSSHLDNPDVPVDGDLAERVAQGDRAAEDALVQRYAGRVLAMALARTRNRESSREIVDDVLMAVIEALRRGTVRDTSRLAAFVHGIARNLINNHLRVRGSRPPTESIPDDLPGPDGREDCERAAESAQLRRLIDTMDQHDREIIVLALVEGLSPAEIADQTGLSKDVVRQRKHRALSRLQAMLAQQSRRAAPAPHN
jgi:RNA polymerase sigma-70 factor (ECF subfamily)